MQLLWHYDKDELSAKIVYDTVIKMCRITRALKESLNMLPQSFLATTISY